MPRSIKDHETNSLAFHDGKLYVTQGSMNAMGATDGTWKRAEHLLSAAVLELDPAKLPANLPVDVSTPDMVKEPSSNRADREHLQPVRRQCAADVLRHRHPQRLRPGLAQQRQPVRRHQRLGCRWQHPGRARDTCPRPAPTAPTAATPVPSAPALTNNRQDETDYFFNVKKGKYYGHPNPLRCEYILNAGNPTGYTGNPLFKVNAYPAGQQADPNYDLANVNDAGMHASANGSLEYQNAGAFGGALKGKLVQVRYSANQELVTFDVRANGNLSSATTGHHRVHRLRPAARRRRGPHHRQPLRQRAAQQLRQHRHQAAQAPWRRLRRAGRGHAAPGLHRGDGRRGQRPAERDRAQHGLRARHDHRSHHHRR